MQMKSIKKILSLLLATMLLLSLSVWAEGEEGSEVLSPYRNLFANGDFSDGITGWSNYDNNAGSISAYADDSYDGNGSLYMNKVSANGALQASARTTLNIGTTYLFSAQVKNIGNTDSLSLGVDLRVFDSALAEAVNGTTVSENGVFSEMFAIWGGWLRFKEQTVAGRDWTEIRYVFTLKNDNLTEISDVWVALRGATANAEFLVDNMVLTPYVSYADTQKRAVKLYRGDFEDGTKQGFTMGTYSTEKAYTGIGSLYIAPGAQSSMVNNAALSVKAGTQYVLSAYIYAENQDGSAYSTKASVEMGLSTKTGTLASMSAGDIKLRNSNIGGKDWWSEGVVSLNEGWNRLEAKFTPSADCDSVAPLLLVFKNNVNRNVYIDDVVIEAFPTAIGNDYSDEFLAAGTTGWNNSGTSHVVEDGILKVTDSVGYGAVFKGFGFEPGETYSIIAMVKVPGASTSEKTPKLQLRVATKYGDWNQQYWDQPSNTIVNVTDENWHRLTMSFTAPVSENAIDSYSVSVQEQMTKLGYWIDSIRIKKAGWKIPEISASVNDKTYGVSYTVSNADAACMIRYRYLVNNQVVKAGYALPCETLPALLSSGIKGTAKAELTPICITTGVAGETIFTNEVVNRGSVKATLKIWSGDGLSELDAITEEAVATGVYGVVSYENTIGEDMPAQLILVSYGANGAVNVVRNYPVTLTANGDTLDAPTIEEDTFPVEATDTKVSMFLWTDINDTLTPIAEAETISASN